MTRIILACLALVALAGCGRTGPPRPPGPREAIIYPRAYPAREGTGPAAAAPVPIPPAIAVPYR
jgi:Prokaryotic lipoprotein-attachment site